MDRNISIMFGVLFYFFLIIFVMCPMLLLVFWWVILPSIPACGTLFVYFAGKRAFMLKGKHRRIAIANIIIVVCLSFLVYYLLYVFCWYLPPSFIFQIWMLLPLIFFVIVPLSIGMPLAYLKVIVRRRGV